MVNTASQTLVNLLLVEDEALIALNQKQMLNDRGYNVIHSFDGENALRLVNDNKNSFDLILMDVDLGRGKSGIETASRILKEWEIPILFLSSHTEEEIVKKTESITSYGYVVKSSNITVLDASIKMALKLFKAHIEINRHKNALKMANIKLLEVNKKLKGTNTQLKRLERAVSSSRDIIFITDNKGTITFINPQFTHTYGYPEEEVIGKMNPGFLNSRIISARGNYAFWTKIQEEKYFYTMFTNKKKNGESITVEASISPVFNEKVEATEFVQIHRDVSKQIQTERNIQIKTAYLDFINKIVLRQSNIHDINEFYSLLTKQLREFSNAVFVSFTEFDKKRRVLKNLKISASFDVFKKGAHLAGEEILKIEIPVDREYLKEIKNTRTKISQSLNESTRGGIDEKLSKLIKETLSIGKFISLSYCLDSTLYGTSIIALGEGISEPDRQILQSFMEISAISIKRILLEKNVMEDREILKTIIEQSPIGIYRTTPGGNILLANSAMIKMLGYDSFDDIKSKDLDSDFFGPVYNRSIFKDTMDREGKITGWESMWRRKDGSTIFIRESAVSIRNPDGTISYYQGMVEDISDKKILEIDLARSKFNLDLFFDQSLTGFFFMTLDEPVAWNDSLDKEKALDYILEHQKITRVNKAFLEQYGATEEQLIGYTVVDFFNTDIMRAREITRELFDLGKLHAETEESRIDGSTVFIEGSYSCIYNSEGEITGTFGAQQDITKRKLAEIEILNLLKQKDLILRESHHRIKNNLMTIKSVINLESNLLGNDKVTTFAKNIEARIESMILLYNQLSSEDSFKGKTRTKYLKDLIQKILNSFPHDTVIDTVLDIEDFEIGAKTSFKLGLIINEILTNIFKHAFRDQLHGKVTATLFRDNSFLSLTISDNGSGIPPGYLASVKKGFGLQLIEILSCENDGSINIETGNGTNFIIRMRI